MNRELSMERRPRILPLGGPFRCTRAGDAERRDARVSKREKRLGAKDPDACRNSEAVRHQRRTDRCSRRCPSFAARDRCSVVVVRMALEQAAVDAAGEGLALDPERAHPGPRVSCGRVLHCLMREIVLCHLERMGAFEKLLCA